MPSLYQTRSNMFGHDWFCISSVLLFLLCWLLLIRLPQGPDKQLENVLLVHTFNISAALTIARLLFVSFDELYLQGILAANHTYLLKINMFGSSVDCSACFWVTQCSVHIPAMLKIKKTSAALYHSAAKEESLIHVSEMYMHHLLCKMP